MIHTFGKKQFKESFVWLAVRYGVLIVNGFQIMMSKRWSGVLNLTQNLFTPSSDQDGISPYCSKTVSGWRWSSSGVLN